MSQTNWYKNLKKSNLTPPDIVFGIVWPILYTLIAISFVVFIRTSTPIRKNPAIIVFLIQLVLNLSWSPVFFKRQNIKLSLVIIVLTLIFTLINIWLFYKINPISAYLLIPYAVWLMFATYLNAYIYVKN